MSLAMCPLAPNLEEPTATDDGKVPALVAELSVPIKNMAGLSIIFLCASAHLGEN
jgi:hypothetical protein